MALDAYQLNDEFVIKADLAGVKPEDIDVTIEDNVLTIKAERDLTPPNAADLSPEAVQYAISERAQGQFVRQIIIGDNLDTSKITASYESGVLTLSIPVAPHAKPRKISVDVKGQPSLIEASTG